LQRSRDQAPLTPRQIEVLELMARGLTNPEIAGVLGVARATVKAHVAAIIEALDVSNRTEAAMVLRELGLAAAENGSNEVPGFGRRPAIAVLPFDNLSNDPDQDVFADGLVEDLTTRLAMVRWFPVIARNSAFAFREAPRDLKEISRALEARYLIEGSTRRAGTRTRIHVQVIDAENGHHVFAEKFDREVDDVFAVQDEIVDAIAGALEPALLRIEALRALARPPAQLDTWERVQRGAVLVREATPESVDAAIPLFEAAIADDPHFAPAHAGLAMARFTRGLILARATQFSPADPQHGRDAIAAVIACFQEAAAAGRRATELDPFDPNGWMGLGAGLGGSFQLPAARSALERAVDLNPSSALGCWGLGTVLMRSGEWQAALPLYERAVRLSPRDPNLWAFEGYLAIALWCAGRFEEALAWTRRSVEHESAEGFSMRPLAPACLVGLGRPNDARREVERIRTWRPHFNLGLVRILWPPDAVDALADAFAAAGWDLRSTDAAG
jgi:adenylate cyclase